ncbi:MAG: chorismate synthase [Bacteroidia bacterium]
MNTWGRAFRVTTFGESHGKGLGVVIDGCPAGIVLDESFISYQLSRRRPGQSAYTSPRQETDSYEILSGLYEGKTTGAPLTFWVANRDARPAEYAPAQKVLRPSHADFVYLQKYGHYDPRGGGRASARETVCRVLAGSVAELFLKTVCSDFSVVAWVKQLGPYVTTYQPRSRQEVDRSPLRCPDPQMEPQMKAYLEKLQAEGDTTGGIIACQIHGIPPGLGEPLYDKLSARLAYAMLSINAAKGFAYGEGFQAASRRGSQHNDLFTRSEGKIRFATNHAGGILAGISTGEPIYFEVAFKPIATLGQPQPSYTHEGTPTTLHLHGRHDPTPLPRAVPIVEAMAALVIADFWLLQPKPL